MTLTTAHSVPTTDTSPAPARRAGGWPVAGVVAALALGAFPVVGTTVVDDDVVARGPLAVYDAVADSGVATHVSMDLAFVGALALALFATGFLRLLAGRAPADSAALVLARLGLGAAVGLSLALACLKAAYRGGLPDHMDHAAYTRESVGAFQPFVDQVQYTGLWPLTLVMAAVVALALRDRVLPRWYGVLSAVVLVATLAMALVLGLPYFAGLVGPLWLLASAGVGLRSRAQGPSA